MEKAKYKLIVDNGKPYEQIIFSKEKLFNELKALQNQSYPYCDIIILKEVDITAEIFKELNKNTFEK